MQHIQTVQLTAANQPGQSTLQGNSLAVYAPRVNPATVHQARPAQVSQTIAHPTFNRGDFHHAAALRSPNRESGDSFARGDSGGAGSAASYPGQGEDRHGKNSATDDAEPAVDFARAGCTRPSDDDGCTRDSERVQ